ncbi:MAG: hypothetical protein ACI9RO_000715 [Alteromonas macleodii]|jgi:hypothetical protein
MSDRIWIACSTSIPAGAQKSGITLTTAAGNTFPNRSLQPPADEFTRASLRHATNMSPAGHKASPRRTKHTAARILDAVSLRFYGFRQDTAASKAIRYPSNSLGNVPPRLRNTASSIAVAAQDVNATVSFDQAMKRNRCRLHIELQVI